MRGYNSAVLIIVFSLTYSSLSAPVYFSGTGHFYELVQSAVDWSNAETDARTRSFNGVNGYLACVSSAAENDFLVSKIAPLMRGSLFQAWVGGYQPDGSDEPAGNWTWLSGEQWNYSNWADGQPNNDWSGTEHCMVFYTKQSVFGEVGQWGDARQTEQMYYIVEYPGTAANINAKTMPADGTVAAGLAENESRPPSGMLLAQDSRTVSQELQLRVFGAIELEFFTKPDVFYFVQASPDLLTWTNFDGPILGNGLIWRKLYSAKDTEKQYFRLKETPR